MSQRNPASDGSGSPPRPRATGTWVVVAVLLGIGIVVPLLVGIYARATPTLWGFPFFYWFQFLMIPVVSVLTFIAFRLSLSRDRARPPDVRAARRARVPGGRG